jgi:hypothetical protein
MAYLDEGLDQFRDEWKRDHPGAVVYWVADDNHSQNPRASQHAADDGKSGGPGDDIGEVDAVDVMPGHGVTDADLDSAFERLRASRDPRIKYMIRRDKIVSSETAAWEVRDYQGEYHHHLHISVNDKYDNNRADWHWEAEPEREIKRMQFAVSMPELKEGDSDDKIPGPDHIVRIQRIMKIKTDGDWGPVTTAAIANWCKYPVAQCRKMNEDIWRRLYGLGHPS